MNCTAHQTMSGYYILCDKPNIDYNSTHSVVVVNIFILIILLLYIFIKHDIYYYVLSKFSDIRNPRYRYQQSEVYQMI